MKFIYIDYNNAMNLDELRGKSVLLLGKSRALSSEEFASQLQLQHIGLLRDYDESVVLIAEGRLMNPIEQELHDELYAKRAAPIVSVDELEKLLCAAIDGERLLMSLKLGNDQTRLLGFLQNPLIPDALFLRLIKLFDWQGEGLFENDGNRDATAALIERFYENIERNHNVQYANIGLMHLLHQSADPELVETVATLPPLQQALKKGCDNSTYKILRAIASHPASSQSVLKQFVKYADGELCSVLAQRGDLDERLQQQLFERGDAAVTTVLAENPALCDALYEELLQDEAYRSILARSSIVDEKRFRELAAVSPSALAANTTLDQAMQRKLLQSGDEETLRALAANSALDEELAGLLFKENFAAVRCALAANPVTPPEMKNALFEAEECHAALAGNEQTPPALLLKLGESGDIEVLSALAKNPATPVALLYQLQLDKRLERYVMANEGFGRHIQTENIGWL